MTTAAAAWFAVAFFLVPGFVINWVAGMRAPAAVAAALPVTFGVVGMGAWMWGLTTAPFNLWTYGVSLAIALAAAAAWRYAFARRARKRGATTWRKALVPGDVRRGSVLDPSWLLPAAGVAAGAWMAIRDRLDWLRHLPNGVYNIVQGWDSQWHANAVRFILDEGVASSTRMGELQNVETNAALLYPSGFHAGVALYAQAAGLEAIPALNIAAIVLTGLALPLTMACLVFAFMRSTELTAQIAAGLAAAAIYALPQVLWIPDYVGMWPYQVAMGLTGMVIWLFVSVPAARNRALPAAAGFLGVLTVHPSAVTVVVLGVVLFWLTGTLVKPDRSRLADTVWMGVPAITASLAFLPQMFAGSEQAGEVSGWQAKEAFDDTDAWESAFMLDTRHVPEFFPTFDPTVLLWLAGFGALVLLLWRGQIWPALFYAVSLVATVQAIDPLGNWFGDAVAVVSNLHYNTPHRLIVAVALALTAAAAVGVAAMIRLAALAPVAARIGSARWVRGSTAAAAALAVAVGAWAVPGLRATAVDGAQESFQAARATDRMVSADDVAAFTWLASQPAAHEGYTMGDPADGHSWLYAFTGVPTVSRHYLWPAGGRGSAFDIAFYEANSVGEGLRGNPNADNVADKAVERLGVNFYVLSPYPFWASQHINVELNRGAWASEGLTPVYRRGQVVVFAVDDAFTPAELRALRSDALKAGSDPVPTLEAATPGEASQAAVS